MEYNIIHNEAEKRFETVVEGIISVVEYETTPGVLTVTHTRVPKKLEGRGIAAALTKALLNYIFKKGLKVNPQCPYTKTYIERHGEYQSMLSDKQ